MSVPLHCWDVAACTISCTARFPVFTAQYHILFEKNRHVGNQLFHLIFSANACTMPRSVHPITLESEIFDKKCQMLCLRYPHAPQDSSAEVTTPPFVQELYRLL